MNSEFSIVAKFNYLLHHVTSKLNIFQICNIPSGNITRTPNLLPFVPSLAFSEIMAYLWF